MTERKKEKNCKLGVFGRTSDFNYFIGGLDTNVVLRPGILFLVCTGIVFVNSSKNLYFYFVTYFCILIYLTVKLSGTLLSLILCYTICYFVKLGNQTYVTYGIKPQTIKQLEKRKTLWFG